MDGNLALVHNGIIENYSTLRSNLEAKGVQFYSETDTEILVKLIGYIRERRACSLHEAVRMALHLAIGAYAIAVVSLTGSRPNGGGPKILSAGYRCGRRQ